MSNELFYKAVDSMIKPLEYLRGMDYRKIDAVKNLSEYIQAQCKKIATEFADHKPLLVEIAQLFLTFDEQSLEEKIARIEQTLLLLKQGEKPSRFAFMPHEHPTYSLEDLQKKYEPLSKKIQFLKGVGPKISDIFFKHGIENIYDLMNFFPYRYEDRRRVLKIKDATDGVDAVFMGEVVQNGISFYKGLRKRVYEIQVQDETGLIKLKWFRFYASNFEKIKRGTPLIVSGKVKAFRGKAEIYHPEIEIFTGEKDNTSFGKVVPVYYEVGGLYQKTIRRIMDQTVRTHVSSRVCLIPPAICEAAQLSPPWKVMNELHSPERVYSEVEILRSKRSLVYEELFFFCLATLIQKSRLQKKPGISFHQSSPTSEKVISSLAYDLTAAQKRSLEEIEKDMKSPWSMNRLLQGDVGSGKTIVALLACLRAIDHGYQAVFMAPTEILVEQHYQNFKKWLDPFGIAVTCLVSKLPTAQKKLAIQSIADGSAQLIIGTHAVLEPGIDFKSLGVVIVDEQHRFGVRQRATLRNKGIEPDVLVMSATPIPRTLALTLFSDLDVSILDEFPQGRKKISTRVFYEKERDQVYEHLRLALKRGEQCYIVYPLVEASENLPAKDATSMALLFQQEVFPEFKVGLIHGQMPPAQKDEAMLDFVSGKTQVLVSTTVIEVGIDVPNATCILIEHPERFGLSQLHQLRGRVGRGEKSSSCLLIAQPYSTETSRQRLQIFSETLDGFKLAEEDLRLRGPGDLFGTLQSGVPQFRLAEFPRDMDILENARVEALKIYERDPGFKNPEHVHLQWVIDHLWQSKLKMTGIG